MPLTDAEKDTVTLLSEIKATIEDQPTFNKILEFENRIIKSGDSDDGSHYRGGIRPYHLPLVG